MRGLAGKVAVVTGAGQGLGEAIARRLADEGACVAIVDRDTERARGVAAACAEAGRAAFAIAADVTDLTAVEGMVAEVTRRIGAPHILVNNVGGFEKSKTIRDIAEDEWDTVIRLNLKSAYLCSRAVLPAMIERRWGRIINLGSQAARSITNLLAAHYAAAKGGILALTRHLAFEVGQYGITVNVVAPGIVLTERVRRNRSSEQVAHILGQIPIGRLGLPEDTAAAVAFLASEEAGYITGATLDVNGGIVMM
jgi:3-oxoacyl-[acyl-carrier protein] reductase